MTAMKMLHMNTPNYLWTLMINEEKAIEICARISARYEVLFRKEFWAWVNNPVNIHHKELLMENEDLTDYIVRLAWIVASTKHPQQLFNEQLNDMDREITAND